MLVVGIVLWMLVLRPVLDLGVSWLAETLVRSFEYPRVTRLVAIDHVLQVRRSDFRSGSAIPTIPLTEIHFNTIVLLALSLSLSRPFSRRRLERLFMAWCVLFVLQSLNLVFHVKCIYALQLGDWSIQNYSSVGRNVFGFLRYFTDLPVRFSAPFLVWMGFNWDAVTELIGTRVDTKSTGKARKKGKQATDKKNG
jgi:hypothetical protein